MHHCTVVESVTDRHTCTTHTDHVSSGGFRGVSLIAAETPFCGVWRLAKHTCIGAREDDPLGAEYGNGWQREANIFYARYIFFFRGER